MAAFVDLASVSILHLVQRQALALSTTPGIRRVGVWLDAIMGQDPDRYLRDDVDFVDYQSSLERLSSADIVLSLTGSAATELPAGCPRSGGRVVVTGSRPGLTMADLTGSEWVPPFAEYAVVVGNSLPHKNVVAGLLGAVVAQRTHPSLGVVIVADMDADRRAEIVSLYERAGGVPDLFAFAIQLDRPDFAALINRASVTVVPSRREGLSLPVIESLELRTPLVVSDIAAHRELLGDSISFADAGDPVSFGALIVAVLDAPEETLAAQLAALSSGHPADRFHTVMSDVSMEITEGLEPPSRPGPSPRWRAPVGLPAGSVLPGSGPHTLAHSKVCELDDFTHADLRPVLEECVDWERLRSGGRFPESRQDRSYWETAMAIRSFRDCGLLDGAHDLLSLGATDDAATFLLTRWARRVTATGLRDPGGSTADGLVPAVTDSAGHWPFPWNPERLEIADLDPRDLTLPDASVDGVFWSGRLSPDWTKGDIRRVLDEILRVLRPGGIFALSTDRRLWGPGGFAPGHPRVEVADLDGIVLADRGWRLVGGFDADVSEATVATRLSLFETEQECRRSEAELGGRYLYHAQLSRYPHVVDEVPGRGFTSVHLLLRKDD